MPTVSALQPGDIVAWLRSENTTSDATGHVMVVLQAPQRNPQRGDEWLVEVADSTTSPHAKDSRRAGDEGLGTGRIGLSADGADHPIGYYWRGGVSKRVTRTDGALGRPAGPVFSSP